MSFSLGSIKIFTVLSLIFLSSACGFHLRDSYNFPEEINVLSLTSFDPYGNLTREMRKRLKLYQIELTKPSSQVANLHLKGESYGESTLSLYQNATVAQRQFAYSVSYTVLIPEKGSYDFSASLTRSYLDNPLTALAKSVEEDMLAQEMRVEASKQIIRQLAQLNASIEAYNNTQAQEEALEAMQKSNNTEDFNVEIRFEGKTPENNPDQKSSK